MSQLYKKFVDERAAALIDETGRIRNCTVIAHVDHGKTTLTDSLIASSGLMSKEVAASARLMDYDPIEQQRGITIKASGISLIHEMAGKDYLIHLIDTPGHIDFSSHVTRGLRLTDGAIVVVDIIEGIMVQTETVTRQAMDELVRPMLFINKVDRLITEKKLKARKIAEVINKTVREFNAMLGKYLDDSRLETWQVSFSRGSLCIGSALDKWGVDIDVLKQKSGGDSGSAALTNSLIAILEDIVDSYANEKEKSLTQRYPVDRVVLDSLVRTVPNPAHAQEYRVPVFWKGKVGSIVGDSLLHCKKDGPCVLLVGDVQPDQHAGTVAAVRVFSGTLQRAKPLRNLRTGRSAKTLQIGLFMSKTRIQLPSVPAGNLAFITGLNELAVGDTLADEAAGSMQPMMGLHYPTEPVVTYSIEPKSLSELSTIQSLIEQYVTSDPALEFRADPDTGEMLLSGAGELHIEVTVEKLARQGINVALGKPMVLLREQMTINGRTCVGGGATTSKFSVKAVLTPDAAALHALGTFIDTDPRSACNIVDSSTTINPLSDEAEMIREGFRVITRNGPLAGERLRKTTFIIETAELRTESAETSWRDVTQPLLQAARESFMSGHPLVLEPWVRLEISAPEEHIGTLTAIVAKRKGRVLQIDSERTLFRVEAEIPVRESFGLANEIRTSTSGWATWGAKAGGYRRVGASSGDESFS